MADGFVPLGPPLLPRENHMGSGQHTTTHGQTLQLLDRISPVGRFGENLYDYIGHGGDRGRETRWTSVSSNPSSDFFSSEVWCQPSKEGSLFPPHFIPSLGRGKWIGAWSTHIHIVWLLKIPHTCFVLYVILSIIDKFCWHCPGHRVSVGVLDSGAFSTESRGSTS